MADIHSEFNALLLTFVSQTVAVAGDNAPLKSADVEAMEAALNAGGASLKRLPAAWIAGRLGHFVEQLVDETQHSRELLVRMQDACRGEEQAASLTEPIAKLFDTVIGVYDDSPEERQTLFSYLCSIVPAAVGAEIISGDQSLQNMLDSMMPAAAGSK